MRLIDGKPVFDADKVVAVHITAEDCARGSKKDPEKCAVALALSRIPQCDESRVHLGCTYLRFGDKWLRYATPPSLKAEIISFDRGGGFYPGDFRLHPMPEALRLKPAKQKSAPARRRTVANAAEKVKVENKKGEPRVFHRVLGVRDRAIRKVDASGQKAASGPATNRSKKPQERLIPTEAERRLLQISLATR
jgi:hypothetical protein